MVQKETPKRRGRPRAYDPDTALTQAIEAFWRTGYSATSLDQLSEATGMNRPSLYGAFGDKRELYLAALDRYTELSNASIARALDYERPLAEALTRFYDSALRSYLHERGPARGCFLIGTALTESVEDPQIRARLREALRGFDRAVEARLRHAQVQGELDMAVDIPALASIASAVLHSLAVRARAGDTRAALEATAAAGVRLICGAHAAPAGRRGKSVAAARS